MDNNKTTACWCILGGTKACKTCGNNPNSGTLNTGSITRTGSTSTGNILLNTGITSSSTTIIFHAVKCKHCGTLVSVCSNDEHKTTKKGKIKYKYFCDVCKKHQWGKIK